MLFPTCNRTVIIAEEKVLDLRRVWTMGGGRCCGEETYSYFGGHQIDLVKDKDQVLVGGFCANVLLN